MSNKQKIKSCLCQQWHSAIINSGKKYKDNQLRSWTRLL